MKLKIVSDGTFEGTKVVEAVSGELIENVTALKLELVPFRDHCEAQIWILHPELEAYLDSDACKLTVDTRII